jgi:signal transduction histidine kinase
VRVVVLVVLLLLGLVEVQSVVQTVRAQSRMRDRVIRTLEGPVVATWPEIARTLRPGGEDAWQRGLEALLARSAASEAEMFDVNGRLLAAVPAPAPVSHWPPALRLQSVLSGMNVTWGPVSGAQPRLLTYAAFPSGDGAVVLRLAAPVPELVEDLRERRTLLVGHGLVLVLLAVAAGLIMLPERPSAHSAHGVEAYAEALGRLRDLGLALNQQHQVERDRLTGEMRDLEAMARAGELTAGIAHEVRNGLGTILGYARLLEQQASPDVTEPARRIREECETLETVVRRFMAFVKRETLQRAAFDLRAMLRRVVARESASHPVGRVDLVAPDEVRIVGDEELLERVFENVVRNACEAAGPRGHARVVVEPREGGVDVRVEDDGPGWPADVSDAFRPFVSTKPGGLGLGLPMARKLVRLHGGDIRLGPRDPGAWVEVSLLNGIGSDRSET